MSLPLIDSAFPEEQAATAFNLVEIAGSAIALIIEVMIGVLACYKMRHSKTASKTGRELLYLFGASCTFACSATISLLIFSLFPDSAETEQFSIFIWLMSMSLFFLTLLITLVWRLHKTFRHSDFRMGKIRRGLFVCVFSLYMLMMVLCTFGRIMIFRGNEQFWTFYSSCLLVALCIYAFGSFLAVRFFVVNLNKLAKLHADSDHAEHTPSPTADGVSLSKQQSKLLNVAAKYILLFFVAIFSTVLSAVLSFILSFEMRCLFLSLDYCVNLFSLYLQFGFAAKNYRKFCNCIDSRCRATVSKRTKKAIHETSLSPPAALQNIDSVSGSVTMQTAQSTDPSDIERK